ncbi:Unknown protein, partial [Striga hermonthica]
PTRVNEQIFSSAPDDRVLITNGSNQLLRILSSRSPPISLSLRYILTEEDIFLKHLKSFHLSLAVPAATKKNKNKNRTCKSRRHLHRRRRDTTISAPPRVAAPFLAIISITP